MQVEIKSGHRRQLPTGRSIARILRGVFKRQLGEVQSLGYLSSWTQPMVEMLLEPVRRYYLSGARDAAKRLRRKKSALYLTKASLVERIVPSFDVWNVKVEEAVRRATFAFCQSTNDTSVMLLSKALVKLREELIAGLKEGEATKKLTRRVNAIFADPERARVIAHSEASRATHHGQLMLAEESGIVRGKRWLASADACDICLPLAARGEIPLDEPFAVIGRGPYSHVMFPPAHPNCMCAMEDVIK